VGQGYVALSRIKSIEGLSLLGLNPMALRVDPLILHVDGRIKQASQKSIDAIESYAKDDLDALFKHHILALGGVVDTEKIAEEKANIKAGKPSRSTYVIPTHHRTKKLIEKSDTLIKLATNRGLAKGTIIQHLERIKEEEPEIDLNKYKPKGELFDEVESVALKLMTKKLPENFTDDGRLRLKPVFEALAGEVGYDDIRLCMLFMDG